MPVSFWVLCCSKCFSFQVHHSKKSKTWACKVCSCNQSVLKVFAEGSAPECRKVVQKLNRQGVLRQKKLSKYGLLNHPRALEWNPNRDLPGRIVSTENSMSENKDSLIRNIDNPDVNEYRIVQPQEISYRLHPYSKTSNSQSTINTNDQSDILCPNYADLNQTNPFLSPSNSYTDSSGRYTSKWDIYL
ncbi:MRN complex-interacting protein [Schistosoma japonicum]|nr:MRN complex-interacting protein [Schistosoma japonicum]KAH8849829.1 MRN complex-interacting protein [Schistosoma japonicum]KAH8849830.1 MRN complex-interacting protein [Schistosoma japonicum]